MRTVGATVIDVANDFRHRIERLPLEYAFIFYDRTRNTIMFTTFFEQLDHEAEEELAKIEGYMIDSFSEYLLDFRTIHLMGRDVAEFIPAGAIPLMRGRMPDVHRAAH